MKQILAKTLEAKTISSYGTLEILGKYVSKPHMLKLIRPFKEQLEMCNSKKVLKKIEDALRRVLLGFMSNQSLSTEDLMVLVHGLLNDAIDELRNPVKAGKKKRRRNEDNNEVDDEDENKRLALLNEHKSCLIIPSEPKRGGDKPKMLTKTNQHVIVEFALQVRKDELAKSHVKIRINYRTLYYLVDAQFAETKSSAFWKRGK